MARAQGYRAYLVYMNSLQHKSATATFRTLHESGCFLLPNPWDIGTTIYLEHLGFKALATTSAGFAFSRGKQDGRVRRDEMLDHIREIVEATSLPVNADFEAGYTDEPEHVARNVRLCLKTLVAGLSIEDNSRRTVAPLYEKKLAIERVRAARRAIDDSETGVVLTGRCEAWLVDDPKPLRTALDRLAAYAEAGADCLYAPGVTGRDNIAAMVRAIAPKPLNVLMSGPGLTLAELADLGVRRVSIGGALARVAWGAMLKVAEEIKRGSFDGLANAAPGKTLNGFFTEFGKR